ncbi:uncharacterized protein [Primulina eburnea]|uniref:uncharacterized protein n=1 Tax=Primulina eburnea TaxID=1245227 RepID=UPI003C6C5BE3
MGSKRHWILIWVFFYEILLPNIQGSELYSKDALNSFLHDYAVTNSPKHHAGILYNVSLPANYSGIEVSIARIRARTLWVNGAHFSFFKIPPRVLPWPFVRRVDLVFQNLGIWSDSYYNVPNYTFIAPVIGLLAYDSNESSRSYGEIGLSIMGENPFIVRLPNVTFEENRNVTAKCVRFDRNGTLEFSNVIAKNTCLSRVQGHFSIVIPSQIIITNKKKDEGLKWWTIGLAGGIVGLVLLLVLGVLAYKYLQKQRIRKMEIQSERSEVLDTIWIGRSRMPSASRIRTQPVLEKSYIP